MKKKSLLRMGAVLLSYGFMINAMNVNTGMVVMAEEFSADEDSRTGRYNQIRILPD